MAVVVPVITSVRTTLTIVSTVLVVLTGAITMVILLVAVAVASVTTLVLATVVLVTTHVGGFWTIPDWVAMLVPMELVFRISATTT